MRIMIGLLLGCALGACTMPAAPLPDRATMAPPIDRKWPESTQQVVWQPFPSEKFMGKSRGRQEWEISVGNDRVVVDDPQKKKYQKLIAPELVDTWKVQIQVWRSQLIHAQAWQYTQEYTPPNRLLSSKSPDAPHVWVFVSDQCQLCDQWKQNWPSHIPATWVPVSASERPDTLWAQRWCHHTDQFQYDVSQCTAALHDQFLRLERLGADTTPALVTSDGRLLTGWPDGAWLAQWWSPHSGYWLAPAPVQEPDM